LAGLERIVCAKLCLKFEFIESDADLDVIRAKYLAKNEPIIQNVLAQLDDETFGALFKRLHATERDRDKFVAVIDCRGEKSARRFFTKWHEVAHMLTLKDQQLELILNRSSKVKKPEEQLMDLIAGRVGFYPTISSAPSKQNWRRTSASRSDSSSASATTFARKRATSRRCMPV